MRLDPLEQREPGRAAELLLLLLRGQAADEAPEPHPAHLPVETLGRFDGRVEFELPPAERLEELRAILWREPERRVAGRELLAPRLLDVLLDARTDEIDQPPLEGWHGVEVARELADVGFVEVYEQSFRHDEHALRLTAELAEERLPLRLVLEVEPDRVVPAHRLFVLQHLELVVEHVGEIDIDPTQCRRKLRHAPRARV